MRTWTAQKSHLLIIAVLWVRVLAPSLCCPSLPDALRPTHRTAIATEGLMAHSSCFNHVKLKKLAKLLKIGRPQALGHLEFLWHYCGDCHLDGDMSVLTDSDIEMAAEWRGKRGAFVGAAIDSGFIDRDSEGTRVHDWDQWAPDYIRKRLRRRIDKHLHTNPADNGRRAADNGGQRPPEPNGTERNRTEPNKSPPTPHGGVREKQADQMESLLGLGSKPHDSDDKPDVDLSKPLPALIQAMVDFGEHHPSQIPAKWHREVEKAVRDACSEARFIEILQEVKHDGGKWQDVILAAWEEPKRRVAEREQADRSTAGRAGQRRAANAKREYAEGDRRRIPILNRGPDGEQCKAPGGGKAT